MSEFQCDMCCEWLSVRVDIGLGICDECARAGMGWE